LSEGKTDMKKSTTAKARKRPSKLRTRAGFRLKVIVEERVIRKRVRELAREINRDYAGKTIHVIGILETGFIFMADLVRALTVPVVCSFIRTQVRDSDNGAVAIREILYIPPVDAARKDLLLVVGVLQSGITLDHLCRTLWVQQPASLRTATLIDKSDDRKIDVRVDYSAFHLSGGYVVGYGLDHQGHYRNLPHLATVIE
jgi:hypoxanthine phosphoribosyltransferase